MTSTSRYTEPNMITAMRSEAVTKYLDVVANGVSKGKGMLDMAKKSVLSRTKL